MNPANLLLIEKILEDLETALMSSHEEMTISYKDSIFRAQILIQHLVKSNDRQIVAAIARNIHKKSSGMTPKCQF